MTTIDPKEVTGINAVYLDCCLPCYFTGSNADEVLCIPVWKEITYQDIRDSLFHEFFISNENPELDKISGLEKMINIALDDFLLHIRTFQNLSGYSHINTMEERADFAQYASSFYEADDGDSVCLYIGLFAETN